MKLTVTLCTVLPLFIHSCNKEDQHEQSAAPSTPSQSSDTDLVKKLLNENLGERNFSFSTIIKSTAGKEIISFNSENPHHLALKSVIIEAVKSSISKFNKSDSPIKGLRRINEASRYFEDDLKTVISAHPEFSCEIPRNAQGKEQRSGYPDLLITHKPSDTKAYLDPKLFEQKSENSTLRTFYFEPKKNTFKVQHNALHFLLGIRHNGVDGDWTFQTAHLVDIATLKVKLKAEFHASNRDLYNDSLIIE